MNKLLWTPSEERIKHANMTSFMEFINKKYKQSFSTYNDLYNWSVVEYTAFWEAMWEFGEIKASRSYDHVLINSEVMLTAQWFTGAKLNFAENLLRLRDDSTALVFKGETSEIKKITYGNLYDQVARVAKSLREMGVITGDRVAGFMPNMIEAVIAMLAPRV